MPLSLKVTILMNALDFALIVVPDSPMILPIRSSVYYNRKAQGVGVGGYV